MTNEQPAATGREIPFQGQLDAAIVRRARRAMASESSGPRDWWFTVAFVSLLLWDGFSPLFRSGPSTIEKVEFLAAMLAFLAIIAAIIGGSLYLTPRKVLNRAHYSGAATESGLRIASEHTQAELPWEVYLKRRIGKGIVLLYEAIDCRTIYPREFFASDGDWQAFVELVRRHVPEWTPREVRRSSEMRIFRLLGLALIVVLLIWKHSR